MMVSAPALNGPWGCVWPAWGGAFPAEPFGGREDGRSVPLGRSCGTRPDPLLQPFGRGQLCQPGGTGGCGPRGSAARADSQGSCWLWLSGGRFLLPQPCFPLSRPERTEQQGHLDLAQVPLSPSPTLPSGGLLKEGWALVAAASLHIVSNSCSL